MTHLHHISFSPQHLKKKTLQQYNFKPPQNSETMADIEITQEQQATYAIILVNVLVKEAKKRKKKKTDFGHLPVLLGKKGLFAESRVTCEQFRYYQKGGEKEVNIEQCMCTKQNLL